MCILLAVAAAPGELWIAANRDERLDRPWEPPRLLLADPPVFGGRDLVGGGTWLGVNLSAAFAVGVTNARLGARPGERSRGSLVLDLASERTLADAVALLGELDLTRYGKFNLFLGDANGRWMATNEPEPTVRHARDAAVVALGNTPVTEPGERVALATLWALQAARLPDGARASAFESLLADHGGADPLCRHGETYGTVCSSLVVLRGGEVARYRFAPGRPCVTPFADVALP